MLSIKMQEGWPNPLWSGLWKQFYQERFENLPRPLLNDDLQNREYENLALQAQKDVYKDQLQKCQDTIMHLKTRYVSHARNPGKHNIIIIVWKHTTPTNDNIIICHIMSRRYNDVKGIFKLRWFDRHFLDHEVIVEIGSPNSIHMFNRFEEEGHVEQRYNHFRLINFTRKKLYVMGCLPCSMMRRNEIFHDLLMRS